MKTVPGLVLVGLGALSQVAVAQEHMCKGPQLGTWKLKSYTAEYIDTHQVIHPYGEHAEGYLNYAPNCRMSAIIVSGDRKPPAGDVPNEAEKVQLFSTVLAYAGTYTVEDGRISHHVDISWNQAWTGTTQVRELKIEGDTLQIRSVPAKNPRDGRVSSSTLVWTRIR